MVSSAISTPEITDRDEPALWRRRGGAVLLALAVETLVLLVLLLGLVPGIRTVAMNKVGLTTFDVSSGDEADAAPEPEAKKLAPRSGEAKAPPEQPVQPLPPVLTDTPEIPESKLPANVLWMTRRDYAATDLGDRKAYPEAPGTGVSKGPPDSALAGGKGPHGETLYAAEWYREPTDAELSAYLPSRTRQGGWGLIACRTAPNYRVVDCQELNDWPRGSGLAGAVRQAAWQFRVRPPRIGGRDMVGEWVSIRIDYTIREAK